MEGKIKNNEQYKDFLEWLTKYIKEIKEVMLLNAWSITFSVTPIKTNSEKRIFTIVRDAQYITANILWYKLTYNIWKNKEIETLEQAVIHELTHVVLTELSQIVHTNVLRMKKQLRTQRSGQPKCYLKLYII